ncbi:MAG TPA: hypothetical protein VMA34_13505 [Terracidiphilus sp.]|nr:hypothetical protein [Terracidiphilus sp.]
MDLSRVAELLWAAGFVGHVALLAVLLMRRRFKEFPVFSSYITFHAALSPVLYMLYARSSSAWYARVYWAGALIDFGLQLGIVFEVARIVMKPTGTWLHDARNQFFLGGGCGILLAAALAWILAPPDATGPDRLEMKGNLFAAFLVCELFFLISSTARRLGLGWRNHVMAIGQGFAAWIVVAVLAETLHGYFGRWRYFSVLEYAHQFVYFGALVYWTVQMWRSEPARRPISPELQEYIAALHRRVEYDVGKLNL